MIKRLVEWLLKEQTEFEILRRAASLLDQGDAKAKNVAGRIRAQINRPAGWL